LDHGSDCRPYRRLILRDAAGERGDETGAGALAKWPDFATLRFAPALRFGSDPFRDRHEGRDGPADPAVGLYP
jgi:hypothetical protein